MPDKKEAAKEAPPESPEEAPAEPTPVVEKAAKPDFNGWYHDAGHSATAEREAAQKARDEAAHVGVPVKESE